MTTYSESLSDRHQVSELQLFDRRLMKPDPLTPPDCDLRDFSWMPLDVTRLRDSDLASTVSGDAFRAAVLLWCASWHQIPTASLPNDDRILAKLAGYGRDVESWTKVRDEALHGFIECSDGRLYHPVIAEKALEAADQRKKQKERTQKATEARRGSKRDAASDDSRNVERNDHRDDSKPRNRHGARNEVQQTRPDKDRERDKEKLKTAVEPLSSSSSRASAQDDDNPTKTVEDSGEKNFNPLGTTLPGDWTPSDADIAAATEYGLDDEVIRAELLTFHAYNAQHGTFSKNWSATWRLWCARWKEREAAKPKQAKPRVEVNTQPTAENWDWACRAWIRNQSTWPYRSLGPAPGQIGCRCPDVFLTRYGISAATGDRVIPAGKEAAAS